MVVAETFHGEIESKSILTLASAFRKEEKWTDPVFVSQLAETYGLLASQMPGVNISDQLDLIMNTIKNRVNPHDPRLPLLQEVKERLNTV